MHVALLRGINVGGHHRLPMKDLARLFEPFYTSARSGTGLGLFIARELCECNHARLNYGRDGDGLSCFRITFTEQEFPLT